jgi:hypothetical protein
MSPATTLVLPIFLVCPPTTTIAIVHHTLSNFKAVVQAMTNGVTVIKRIKTDKSDHGIRWLPFISFHPFDHCYAFPRD